MSEAEKQATEEEPGDIASWPALGEQALKSWKGDEATCAVTTSTLGAHEMLSQRFAGRHFLVTFRVEGSVTGSGTLVCSEEEARARLGLDADARLSPAVEEYARALEAAAQSSAPIRLRVDAEQCVEMTAETLGGLRTLLPVEPLGLIELSLGFGADASLDACVLFNEKSLSLDSEMAQLAKMGVGSDAASRLGGAAGTESAADRLGILMDVELPLIVRLGEAEMTLDELLRLREGSVLDLNKMVDEPAELIVNDTVVALGEVVVVNESFGIRVTELMADRGSFSPA